MTSEAVESPSSFHAHLKRAYERHGSEVPREFLQRMGPYDGDSMAGGTDVGMKGAEVDLEVPPPRKGVKTLHTTRVPVLQFQAQRDFEYFPLDFDLDGEDVHTNFSVRTRDVQKWMDPWDDDEEEDDDDDENIALHNENTVIHWETDHIPVAVDDEDMEDPVDQSTTFRIVVKRYDVREDKLDEGNVDLHHHLKAMQLLSMRRNVATLYRFACNPDTVFVAMEYIPGWTLKSVMHSPVFREMQGEFLWLHCFGLNSTVHTLLCDFDDDYRFELRYLYESDIVCRPKRHYKGYVELDFVLQDVMSYQMPEDIRDIEPLHAKSIALDRPRRYHFTTWWSCYRMMIEWITGMKPFPDIPLEGYCEALCQIMTDVEKDRTMMPMKPLLHIPHTPEYTPIHFMMHHVFLAYISDWLSENMVNVDYFYRLAARGPRGLSVFPTLVRHGWCQ